MTDDTDTDPSQIALPFVDSGMKIGDYRARDLWYGAPGFVALGGSITALATGATDLALPLAVAGVPLAIAGPTIASQTDSTSTGLDAIRAPLRHFRQNRQYPFENADAAEAPFHGVRRIRSDGTVLMADGRLVALLRLAGRNADLELLGETQTYLSALSTRLDETLDCGFRYHSTTTTYDLTDVVAAYREAAFAERYAADEWEDARELLHDIAEWLEDVDTPRWDAREWHHYVVVEVAPEDVDTTGIDEDEVSDEEWLEHLSDTLSRRRESVARAFGATPGVEIEQAGPAEVALLHSRYWSGVEHDFSRVDEIREDRLAELLSAPSYDASEGYVRLGDEYARTYWVAEWPVEPEPGFLRPLTTMRGVDVDVTLCVRHRDKDAVESELKHKIGELDAAVTELEDATDIDAMTVGDDMEAYVKARRILHHTSVQPWALNGYVTVRAGTRAALDRAERELAAVDVARRRELADRCDAVREVAESSPVSLSLLSPDTRQRDLFMSGSPTGRDVYAAVSHRDRYSLVLGGVLGAAFPALTPRIHHADGIEWGRMIQDGAEVRADPFDVGGPGHALFIGDSGSGKTYSTLSKVIRWWLAGENRTIVLCDTFGDFADVVRMLNGDHIVLGGEQTVNPLHISPAPEQVADGVDPLGMKVNAVGAFIAGVLREQGGDPGEYRSLIKQATYETYSRAGITKDPDTHDRESPTMADFRAVLIDIANDPGAVALSESEREIDEIEGTAASLLRKLSGFEAGREYEHLVGHSEAEIAPGGVSYLDLQQMESQGAVGKSVMLQLMLDRVYEAVKRTTGETIFLIDEAHYLLHSKETVEWLQRASRHWRHYDAGVWFASHRPGEFVSEEDGDDHKDTIRAQATTIQFTQTDMDRPVAERFGLNDAQYRFVDERATRGDAGLGYSEALVGFNAVDGWIRTQVRASPLEDALLTGMERGQGEVRR